MTSRPYESATLADRLPPPGTAVPLAAVAAAAGVPVRTLTDWVTNGVKVDGKPVKLRAVKIGGKWVTCEAWAVEFLDEHADREQRQTARDARKGGRCPTCGRCDATHPPAATAPDTPPPAAEQV